MEDEMRKVEREQMYHALCINYTAAYCCDLMTDYMEIIKQKGYSHSAKKNKNINDKYNYTEWINYAYEHIIVKETAWNILKLWRSSFMKTNIVSR